MNPFTTSGYIAPEYFCDREKETARIMEAIRSNRNLTLTSLRRMGKTALLMHVEHNLPKKEFEFLYLDLLPTQKSEDLLNILGAALANVSRKQSGFIEKILKTLAAFRPVVSYDVVTGQPSMTLTVAGNNEAYTGMKQIMELVSGIRKRVVIVLDEFQQITNYGDNNIEPFFRSLVQQYPTFSFIFSGSNKHMLETMFTSPVRPFFGSADMMNLQAITGQEYAEFIQKHFASARISITDEQIEEILHWCRYHTFYVQYFCNRLFGTGKGMITGEVINKVKMDILESFSASYLTYSKILTKSQFDLLRAIAIENEVIQPLAGSFIEKYKLKTTSTVKTALNSLAEKEMIVNNNDIWQVYDVFLMRWLER